MSRVSCDSSGKAPRAPLRMARAELLPTVTTRKRQADHMLTKQRQELILKLLEEKGSITVTEAKDMLGASESTVRRDIVALDAEGRLVKVFGGAVALDGERAVTTYEYTVAQRFELNREEKRRIAKYAASLIEPDDFVYLDAGTTTAHLLDYVEKNGAAFVTNAVAHAQRLAARGIRVFLIGGELKASTEAIIGNQAMRTIQSYHFTKGFFGTNAVTKKSGCTTPDANEATVKQTAMEQCRECYVLCDHTKFDLVSSVTFAPFYGTNFITDRRVGGYEECGNIRVAGEEPPAHDGEADEGKPCSGEADGEAGKKPYSRETGVDGAGTREP